MYILSDKIVTTRKPHVCSACCRRFETGAKMRTQVNTSDGLVTWRECETCQKLLSKYRSRFEDDYDHMCYEGCVNEVLERGQTPEDLLSNLENYQPIDIYAPQDTKVKYTGRGGYDHHKEYANKYLKVDEIYTIDRTDVGGWHTDVYLKEVPGKAFNSVHFVNAE